MRGSNTTPPCPEIPVVNVASKVLLGTLQQSLRLITTKNKSHKLKADSPKQKILSIIVIIHVTSDIGLTVATKGSSVARSLKLAASTLVNTFQGRLSAVTCVRS